MSYTRSPSVVRAESSASVYEVRGRKEEERRGGEGDIRQEHQERCRIRRRMKDSAVGEVGGLGEMSCGAYCAPITHDASFS